MQQVDFQIEFIIGIIIALVKSLEDLFRLSRSNNLISSKGQQIFIVEFSI